VKTFTEEAPWVAAVAAHVSALGCQVPSPDYLESNSYAPQWRVFGNVLEYKLPASHGALIIARATRSSGVRAGAFEFSKKGLRP
jgi:hypothetical protein